MKVIDCAARIEPHWHWDSCSFVSQSRRDGDEFQEFGLKWRGSGFSQVSAPGWKRPEGADLDAFGLGAFAGVAAVVDLEPRAALAARIQRAPERQILVLRSGHGGAVSRRSPEYWRRAPRIPADLADLAAGHGFRHVATDVPCDSLPPRRPDGSGGVRNANEDFRDRAHRRGLLVTENCENLAAIPAAAETFFVSLPLAIPGATTSPCRPIALHGGTLAASRWIDLSTPLDNHWRWKLDVRPGRSFAAGDGCREVHFDFGGHGFTHCDAPCHMVADGAGMQELEQEGLARFLGPAQLVDLSDLPLPTPITLDLLRARAAHLRPGMRVILHSGLTDRLGYASREWHLRAPHLEADAAAWLAARQPAAVGLDFPQDYIAREMPDRHVLNREFVAHHAILGQGIPFVEDLRDLGSLRAAEPFLLAVPLRMDCPDGAPMRVIAVEG